MKNQYIDFNDPTIPIETRKVAFVKWLMQKHKLRLADAKLAAHRKFGPSETNRATKARARQETRLRKAEQQAIRQYGHVSQYDTPMPGTRKEDFAALLLKKAEQQATRRYGHVSQYDTPMPGTRKEDFAALLERLRSSPS